MTYHQHIDGEDEWVAMLNYPTHKIACCDCGLVHQLEFRKTEDGLEFRAKRDNRATAQKRRHTRNRAPIATTPS